MEISAIKGGGVRRLMANAIKNFHFDFLTTSLINFSQKKKVFGKFYPQLCPISIAYSKKKQSMAIDRSRLKCQGKPSTAIINDLDRRVVYLTKVAIGVINVKAKQCSV